MSDVRRFASLLTLAIFTPYPTWEHFIWPLAHCIHADTCNHTWAPECGIENASMPGKGKGKRNQMVHLRLFLDECDMHEYNCDKNRGFVVTNYSLCFGGCMEGPPAPPTTQKKRIRYFRMGDFRMDEQEKQMIYVHTNEYGNPIHTHDHTHPTLTFPTTTRPNLPPYMMSGRRRYTPYGPNRRRHGIAPNTRTTTKVTPSRKAFNKRTTKNPHSTIKTVNTKHKITTPSTVIFKTKRAHFVKNNKTFVRIYKSVVRKVKKKNTSSDSDSDFSE